MSPERGTSGDAGSVGSATVQNRPILMGLGPGLAAVLFGVAAVAIGSGAFLTLERWYAWLAAGFALLMLFVAIFGTRAAMRAQAARDDWADAARARGFHYRGRIGAPGLPGLVFRAGEKVVADDVVDALDSPTPFLAGSVTGTYAADSSLPRVLASSFIALPLPREVPNLVLMGKGLGVLSFVGVAVTGRQRLSLEGDFDRTFTLYAPTDYERDALYLFAPDLMALLVDAAGTCDVEFVDGWMFVYGGPGRFTDAGALDRILAVVATLRGKLERQTARYSDDRSARPATATPRTVSPGEYAATRAVADAGRRVRTRATVVQTVLSVGSGVLLVGALAAWLFFTP